MPISSHPQSKFFSHSTIFVLALAFLSSWATPAHSEPDTKPSPNPHLTGIELEPTPARIDALNLNILLPVGSVTETTRFGSNASMGVGFPEQLGVMTIKEQRSSNAELTTAEVADSIIGQLTGRVGATSGRLLERNESLEINNRIGQRFYIRLLGINGNPDTIRGMTIFQSQPRKFIIFDFTTLAKNFEISRDYYETSIATMDLGNPTMTDLKRAAAIKSMLGFLDSRTIEDFQAAMTGKKDRWERLYLPATTGDEMDATEFGYRKITSWGGFKGELSEKPRTSWNEDDHNMGYFIQIDAMALEEDYRVDTRATFYMSEDSQEESWTIKMSLRREGQPQQTSIITGARSENSMAILTRDQSSEPPTKTHPTIQGEGYISQTLSYLISAMLAKDATDGEYASYAYNSSLGTISLRRDIVDHPEDTPDLITVTTQASINSPPNISYYDHNAKLLRVRLSNKRIWEPITLERLIKLWTKKGLPLD